MSQQSRASKAGAARSVGRDLLARLTCVVQREGRGFVALCPEVDVASQGRTVEAARANLIEALELFFETASASEVARRLRGEVYVSPIDVRVPARGKARVG
jgi:predicted RNase H-like HicB family nuclease